MDPLRLDPGALRDALVDAFPRESDIDELLQLGFGSPLAHLVETTGTYPQQVLCLITDWAEPRGVVVVQLLRQARRRRADNPSLVALEATTGWRFSTEQLMRLEAIHPETSFSEARMEELARRCAPRGWLFPEARPNESRSATFQRLADSLSTAPDAEPGGAPLLAFVDHLATEAAPEKAASLRAWIRGLEPGSPATASADAPARYLGRTVEEWERELQSPDPQERSAAAFGLGQIGEAALSALPALLAGLRSAKKKLDFVEAIGRIAPRDATNILPLIDALDAGEERARSRAIDLLVGHGTVALPPLFRALEDPARRKEVCRALARIGPPAVARLLDLATHPETRSWADDIAPCLGAMDSAAQDEIARVARPRPELWRAAIRALLIAPRVSAGARDLAVSVFEGSADGEQRTMAARVAIRNAGDPARVAKAAASLLSSNSHDVIQEGASFLEAAGVAGLEGIRVAIWPMDYGGLALPAIRALGPAARELAAELTAAWKNAEDQEKPDRGYEISSAVKAQQLGSVLLLHGVDLAPLEMLGSALCWKPPTHQSTAYRELMRQGPEGLGWVLRYLDALEPDLKRQAEATLRSAAGSAGSIVGAARSLPPAAVAFVFRESAYALAVLQRLEAQRLPSFVEVLDSDEDCEAHIAAVVPLLEGEHERELAFEFIRLRFLRWRRRRGSYGLPRTGAAATALALVSGERARSMAAALRGELGLTFGGTVRKAIARLGLPGRAVVAVVVGASGGVFGALYAIVKLRWKVIPGVVALLALVALKEAFWRDAKPVPVLVASAVGSLVVVGAGVAARFTLDVLWDERAEARLVAGGMAGVALTVAVSHWTGWPGQLWQTVVLALVSGWIAWIYATLDRS